MVTTVIGLCENFKHLVNPTHDDDKDFDSVVKLVEQGYKLRKSDWEQGFVDVFLTAEDIGQQRGNEDKDVQQKYKVNVQQSSEFIALLMFYKGLSNLKLLSFFFIL